MLLEGPEGCGKTALAAHAAIGSGFPFVRVVSADTMIDKSDSTKSALIAQVFADAYRSPFSLIILDDIERIIEFVPLGTRFANTVLRAASS